MKFCYFEQAKINKNVAGMDPKHKELVAKAYLKLRQYDSYQDDIRRTGTHSVSDFSGMKTTGWSGPELADLNENVIKNVHLAYEDFFLSFLKFSWKCFVCLNSSRANGRHD